MPRTSTAPKELTRLDKARIELAKHKMRIRNQKKEINKLKRSIKDHGVIVANLRKANDYLVRTADSAGEAEKSPPDSASMVAPNNAGPPLAITSDAAEPTKPKKKSARKLKVT